MKFRNLLNYAGFITTCITMVWITAVKYDSLNLRVSNLESAQEELKADTNRNDDLLYRYVNLLASFCRQGHKS